MRAAALLLLLALPAAAEEGKVYTADDCKGMRIQRAAAFRRMQQSAAELSRQRTLWASNEKSGWSRFHWASVEEWKRTISNGIAAAEQSQDKARVEMVGLDAEIPACLVSVEAQQTAEAKAEEERKARIAEHRKSPTTARLVLSAQLCWYDKDRRDALAVIAKERRYASLPGASKVGAAIDAGKRVRRADDRNGLVRAAMAKLKLKAQPCTDKDLASLVACLDHHLGSDPAQYDYCEQVPFVDYLHFVKADAAEEDE